MTMAIRNIPKIFQIVPCAISNISGQIINGIEYMTGGHEIPVIGWTPHFEINREEPKHACSSNIEYRIALRSYSVLGMLLLLIINII